MSFGSNKKCNCGVGRLNLRAIQSNSDWSVSGILYQVTDRGGYWLFNYNSILFVICIEICILELMSRFLHSAIDFGFIIIIIYL